MESGYYLLLMQSGEAHLLIQQRIGECYRAFC